jgi:hypothetical protein
MNDEINGVFGSLYEHSNLDGVSRTLTHIPGPMKETGFDFYASSSTH